MEENKTTKTIEEQTVEKQTVNSRDYYKILVISQPGKGKTYSFRNMDPNITGYINVENKPLPFKNNFKYYKATDSLNEVKLTLREFAENPEIKVIVFDSLSAYFDLLLAEARATKKNYDVWSFYNEELFKLFKYIKTIQKEIFLTAHYEWVSDDSGAVERRLKTKGKEWEGVVEKEFTITLYVDKEIDTDLKKVQGYFYLALDKSSAKCIPGIYPEEILRVPNDSWEFLLKLYEFINVKL